MVQYCVWSSSKSMAARRLKPLPAIPFAGRGMVGWPVGLAVAARRNTLFSANRIMKLARKRMSLFTYLAIFLTSLHIEHAMLHLIKKNYVKEQTC